MAFILGLSAYYHDSAAALAADGRIVAAAQEERFSRNKHDAGFPSSAVQYCLQEAGIEASDLAAVQFYERPAWKFGRLIESHLAGAPAQYPAFEAAMSAWLSWKLRMGHRIRGELKLPRSVPINFCDHHRCHAASAFHVSPFSDAAIVTLDAVGEWTTTAIHRGSGHDLVTLKTLCFPHSLGLLYSAFTALAGFRVNDGEYQLMGLAPHGEARFAELVLDRIVQLMPDGSFRLKPGFIDSFSDQTLVTPRLEAMFETHARRPGEPMRAVDRDLAASIQSVTATVVERIASHARQITGQQHVCFSGGVALNCAALGRLIPSLRTTDLWVQPASGDAGCAIGAALECQPDAIAPVTERRRFDPRLGPSYSDDEIEERLHEMGVTYRRFDNVDALLRDTAIRLSDGKVIAWFQDRMEFGPRALGSRSILADPRPADMQAILNSRIKHREAFRPFAPAVLRTEASEWFAIDVDDDLPWMSLVVDVRPAKRSVIPAVTHVDGTARLQTVDSSMGRFHRLLQAFDQLTGCPVLVNTSFNVAGEPIVCTPADAVRCFASTDLDVLVIGTCVVTRPDVAQSTRIADRPLIGEPRRPLLSMLRQRAASSLEPVKRLISRAALSLFYFGVFFPLGIGLRCLGYDPLGQRPDEGATTYWVVPRSTESHAASRVGVVGELALFLREEKKWWLAPILIVSLLLMLLVAVSASPVAPFVYTLF